MPDNPHCFNIFLSHVHCDHLIGLPFFAPAHVPGNRLRIYGCQTGLREALEHQQCAPYFPADLDAVGATIELIELEPGVSYEVAGFAVTAIQQAHSDDSYGYRFECGGKVIVYSPDSEV